MRLTLDVEEVDPSGIATIRVTYGKTDVDMSISDGGETIDFAADLPMDPLKEVFDAIEGKSVVIRVDRTGDVVGVDGGRELARHVKSKLEEAIREGAKAGRIPAEAVDLALSSSDAFKEMFSDDSTEDLVKDLFAPTPPKPVKVGESWTLRDAQEGSNPRIDDETYTLESLENGVARLALQVKTSPNPDAPAASFAGIKGKVNLTGSGTGTMTVDERGWVPTADYDFDHTGSFKSEASLILPRSVTVPMSRRGRETFDVVEE